MPTKELRKKTPLIFDGAMGTYLKKLKDLDLAIEAYNREEPDLVSRVHRDYIEAGAQAIKANTFGANPLAFSKTQAKDLLERGARLALEFKDQVQVFASIGPMDTLDKEDYLFVAQTLYKEGIRNFLWETFPEADLLIDVIETFTKDHRDTRHITSFAVFPTGESRLGILAETLLDKAQACPKIEAMGLNCISGPYHLVQLFQGLKTYEKPLGLMPNSGYPTMVDGRLVYKENPQYFAKILSQAAKEGLSYLGGCCGTDPAYIKALINQLGQDVIKEIRPRVKEEVKIQEVSQLKKKLEKGKKLLVVEYDPPQEASRAYFDQLDILQKLPVDAITLADCPIGRARMDASLTAMILKKDYGLNSLVHMTCRDRNLNAIKALLLGLSLEGIQDLLLVTGDPVPQADREEIKAVFQFNSQRLAAFIKTLNKDLDRPFTLAGALNINAPNFKGELNKAKRKVESGMELFLTQPIMGKKAIENLAIAREELDMPILAGIMPLVSYRNAQYLHNQVSGMEVDEEVLHSFSQEMTKEEGEAMGIKWALDFMKKSQDLTQGFYLITPFQRLYVIERLLNGYRKEKNQ